MRRLDFRKALAFAFAAAAALAAGCADSNDAARESSQAEQAFLAAMAPHHESAIRMAGIASKRARHGELRKLARDIVTTQEGEVTQIARMHRRLTGETLRPNADAHAQLGLSARAAGMMHQGRHAVDELKRAKRFDRAFIDAMLPHHAGAIRMAQAVLPRAGDAELRRLAEQIVRDQSREIVQMERWRSAWYGAPSPAGGVGGGGAASEPMDLMEREPGGAHERH
jgi:uncharacterized protein (DUF305 family)